MSEPIPDPVVFLSEFRRRKRTTGDEREDCLRALRDIATAIDQLTRNLEGCQDDFNRLMAEREPITREQIN